MKNKFKKKMGVLSILSMFIILAVSSCNNSNFEEYKIEGDNYGKFSEELTIYDESGQNSIIIEVFSDDPSALADYLKSEFKLLPAEIETLSPDPDVLNSEIEDEFDEEEIVLRVHTIFKKLSLGYGYENGFQLDIQLAKTDSRAKRRDYSYTGDEYFKRFRVNRHTGWHKVFLESWYKDINNNRVDIDYHTSVPNNSAGINRYYADVKQWNLVIRARSTSHFSHHFYTN